MSDAPRYPDLRGLTAETVEQSHLPRFPHMTGWFGPILLTKLLWRVILSELFGQYADRRLIEAALDPVSKEEHWRRAQLEDLQPDKDGAIWLDYVSDLGDGFDATYAIAHLIAQSELQIGDWTLPRANAVVMGGDEVYPTAHRDDYKVKTRLPYEFALPDVEGSDKLPIFLLPGNHDWYDGLVNFLAIFCRQKATRIGRWRTAQRRSYFAARLTENWWVWGIDIALVRDMDQPQADYFVSIARAMPKQANIILCSAEPGWYQAETRGDSFRTLSYAAWIAENAGAHDQGKHLKIPLVLSGDSHHYARYSGADTQYVTSGGGGAFLHGTLDLEPSIRADWLRERGATLQLETCYPSKAKSYELLSGNRRFGATNPEATWALTTVYLVLAFVLAYAWRWDVAVGIYGGLLGGLYSYTQYQEGKQSFKIGCISAAHAAAHMAVIAGTSALALYINNEVLGGRQWHWLLWLLGIALITFTIGRWLAGQIFGWYLLITCRHFDLNHNDAFSAMKLDSHRHFLRMRIQGDTLTIFPVRLEQVPDRGQWRMNPMRTGDRSASVFISDPQMKPELVEEPIVIQAGRSPQTQDVKTPSELPPSI